MGFTLVCFMRPRLPLHARVLLFSANVGARETHWTADVVG